MAEVGKQYKKAVASVTAAHLQNAKASDDGTTKVDASYLRSVLNCLAESKEARHYEEK